MSGDDLVVVPNLPSEALEPVSAPARVHSGKLADDARKKNPRRTSDETSDETADDLAGDLTGDEQQHLIDDLA